MSDKALEQKLKSKLKKISKQQGIVFNKLLETLFLERVLVRVSKSKFRDRLIFKGGLCLAQTINLGRETKDIDFLLREIKDGEDYLKAVFKDICDIKHSDGFDFFNPDVQQLSLEHKKYPGYRIALDGRLGKIKNKVTIDVGLGDVVLPTILNLELLSDGEPLFEDSISLTSYPPEFIFSEKLEAILWLRESNGRMKDYYDCHKLIIENALNKNKLESALVQTFKTRGTKLEPIPETFAHALESRWVSFRRKENLEQKSLNDIISEINTYLKELATS